MGPMLFNSGSDGPAMVLSPPQDHPFAQFPSHATPDAAFGSPGGFAAGPSAFSLNSHQQNSPKLGVNHTWKPASSSPSGYVNPSRKRTRSDFADEANDDSYGNAGAVAPAPAPEPVPAEEPIYGEGMVLLNPRTGLALSAESQTGTWYEETVEKAVASAPPVSSRSTTLRADASDIPSRKSQRLDLSAPGFDDITLSTIQKRLQSSTSEEEHRRTLNASKNGSPNEPQIDNFTYLLGISWQKVDHDGDMAPAVRGWEKYIDNHYARHLQGAQILLKNRSMNVYLVAARSLTQATSSTSGAGASSFYLFSDDLAQGQLVGSNWETCLQNLRSTPITFEGNEVLRAMEKTPDRLVESKATPINGFAWHGIPQASPAGGVGFGNENGGLNGGAGMGTGMDMDM
ncbi:hypothetical protein DTO166G4_4536 [Paecilomyces variotii]|nr:hypothetical protein DTO166G4_4536 [Paecilomyces variotii]KAJ9240024.1 hypothetical protein DTO166G5_1889 [Paecilomyces variotii]